MGSLRPGPWYLILVCIILLHILPIIVQGVDPVSQKLRRLTEQFQQFQALTQARLDMLALNQNRRNSSGGLESRVQALNDHWQQTSQDLKDLQQSTKHEIGGLREWSRKLEKKTKRMEGRLALMERNLRESRRYAQKQKTDPGQDFSNLTLELQSQEERLAALQDQRDELLVGLRGLQESLKNQVLRVARLEGQLGEVLGEHQKYFEPQRRSQTFRGGRLEKILNEQIQSAPGGIPSSQIDHNSAANRNPQQSNKYQGTPQQPKHPKALKPRPQTESHPQIQIQYPNPGTESSDHHPHLEPYNSQSQIQVQAQTRSYPVTKEQLKPRQTVPRLHTQIQPPNQQRSHLQLHHYGHHSWFQPSPQRETSPKPKDDKMNRTSLGAQHLQPPEVPPQPWSRSSTPMMNRWFGEEEQENDTKVEPSVLPSQLQLPVRQKIPAWPFPKKDATICNVDSMLFFPVASAENYVTFSLTPPDLHELSVCLWLRVEAQHIGTLLSYATDDNDNQLVLYGRSSPASLTSFSSPPSSYLSSSSSYSLDFVIGDPVYRRLPAWSLLDAHWHHLCILWSSIQGRFWHYTDRRLASSGSNFRKGWEVPGGGSVVLGQEQDTVGGGFDPTEGFAGQVAGFRMWNRVLSPAEVEGVGGGRGVPRGVVLSMEDIQELHGGVQQVSCECLEHCL
ncbi:pentraxin-4 [Xyrichtys novacula]|uniref:Pentraxin-4 n=1 Tax=Xyrichtys novacula TaxID=13765 RepID=A0AAV1GTS0_XYRNO|nr:pentraxin-4 [Xyrichtys novacula]